MTLREVYRRIAGTRMAHIVLGYALCMGIAFILEDLGRQHHVLWPVIVAAFLGVAVQSVLITVITLYHDDDVLMAATIIVVISGVGIIAGQSLNILVQTGSLGPAFVMAAAAPLTLFLRGLVLVPPCAALVWLLRRFRRYVAPDTIDVSSDAG
jgi:hypothetical protein